MFLLLSIGMKRIVIIDDEPSARLVLKGLVEDAGHKVVAEGENGVDAVNACRETKPDLVIMDVRMPVKDGIEAAMEITRFFPAPIMLLTASDDEETIMRAVAAGAMAYLVKPVRAEDLVPAIEFACARFTELKDLKTENAGLKTALDSRKVVEKAKGLLMEKERLTENEAFARLRKISMDKRKSMAEIAEVIILALDNEKR